MVLTVDVPDGLEQEIEEEVGRGRYQNKSELVRDAIRRLLEKREKVDRKRISDDVMNRIRRAREQHEAHRLQEVKEE
jgi:putative addiction module CopG family antidote